MHISIFGLILFLLKSLLGIARQKKSEKFALVHKASESCYNLNISSVGYKRSLLVSQLL